MAAQREEHDPEITSVPTADQGSQADSRPGATIAVEARQQTRPIELVTENGFRIVRGWEFTKTPPPSEGGYRFLVTNENLLSSSREIVVEVSRTAVAQIKISTRDRITRSSSFWIYCAERHLAAYLWENDTYPPAYKLEIDQLTPEDFAQALRWETT